MWRIDYGYIENWLDIQSVEIVAAIFAALEVLETEGPNLGRPLVDTLTGSAVKNLKELRPASPGTSEIRIIFAFYAARQAVMLIAGNKAKGKRKKSKWDGWYKTAIPQAEKLFAEHQKRLGNREKNHERFADIPR